MAAQVEQNFSAAIGEDRTLTFTVLDAAGAAVDVTGATITWAMRTHELSTVNVLAITATSLGGAAGTFNVVITDALTIAIDPRVYYHSAKVTDSSAIETVVALGTASFYNATT